MQELCAHVEKLAAHMEALQCGMWHINRKLDGGEAGAAAAAFDAVSPPWPWRPRITEYR